LARPTSAKANMPVWRIALWIAIACCSAACCGPVSHAPIIERYRAAACIPFSPNPRISPGTREWDTMLRLSDGSKVIVSGAQVPGGLVAVRYPTTGRVSVAANAGDYVYPSDVRMNAQGNLLYVKASGLAGGIWQQTWLFEYDLRAERLVTRQQVVDDALPTECPEPRLAFEPESFGPR
jgi:hypothetical protein